MTAITPTQARRTIDCADVHASLAEVHTAWGEAAWNAGDYRSAVRNWQIAAKFYGKAQREGGTAS